MGLGGLAHRSGARSALWGTALPAERFVSHPFRKERGKSGAPGKPDVKC